MRQTLHRCSGATTFRLAPCLALTRRPGARIRPQCTRARASTKEVKPDLWADVLKSAKGPDLFPTLPVGSALPEGYGDPPPAPPKHRRSGVILHPTSLTGSYGIGEIGMQAFRFIDWMHAAGQQLWQVGIGGW